MKTDFSLLIKACGFLFPDLSHWSVLQVILLFLSGKCKNAVKHIQDLISSADNSEKYNCLQVRYTSNVDPSMVIQISQGPWKHVLAPRRVEGSFQVIWACVLLFFFVLWSSSDDNPAGKSDILLLAFFNSVHTWPHWKIFGPSFEEREITLRHPLREAVTMWNSELVFVWARLVVQIMMVGWSVYFYVWPMRWLVFKRLTLCSWSPRIMRPFTTSSSPVLILYPLLSSDPIRLPAHWAWDRLPRHSCLTHCLFKQWCWNNQGNGQQVRLGNTTQVGWSWAVCLTQTWLGSLLFDHFSQSG